LPLKKKSFTKRQKQQKQQELKQQQRPKKLAEETAKKNGEFEKLWKVAAQEKGRVAKSTKSK